MGQVPSHGLHRCSSRSTMKLGGQLGRHSPACIFHAGSWWRRPIRRHCSSVMHRRFQYCGNKKKRLRVTKRLRTNSTETSEHVLRSEKKITRTSRLYSNNFPPNLNVSKHRPNKFHSFGLILCLSHRPQSCLSWQNKDTGVHLCYQKRSFSTALKSLNHFPHRKLTAGKG